jgi:PEP-CTERM motif
VSKATELAWAKWRLEHPNWKPNPKLHRPKYVMTQKEAVDKVAFACEVPTVPTNNELLFRPADFDPPPPVVNLSPMDSSQIDIPNGVPPEIAEVPQAGTPPFIVPPYLPPVPGLLVPPVAGVPVGQVVAPAPIAAPVVTPEPSSWLLVASGMAGAWLILRRRMRSAA